MSERDVARKLRAFTSGRPVPHGTTLHLPKRSAEETLVLAFVRMGGESRPWGIAVGRPDNPPKIFAVPEARDRELVGSMLEDFAPLLLSHLAHPEYVKATTPKVPYVWLPNASHVEMLHFLAFTYTFAKRGEAKRLKVLNALGRAANWLFQESTRPGQMSCIDASAALREAFTFPAEPIREAHTGYLLAWLETKGRYEARLNAAAEAERLAISTSLDPQIEKDSLADLVESFNDADRSGEGKKAATAQTKIRKVLEPELRRRFDVAANAWSAYQSDPRRVNSGVGELEAVALERLEEYRQPESKIMSGERVWVKAPESDRHSLVAASSYITLEADEGRRINALVHDDVDLQEDLLLSGDGIRGRIKRIIDESDGRKTIAVWIVESDADRPLRIRNNDLVVQAGYAKRKAVLRNATLGPKGAQTFELQITAGIREGTGTLGRRPLDAAWRGQIVTFLKLDEPNFAFRKRKLIWDRQGPGTWLTHQQPWEDWSPASGENDFDTETENV